MCVQPNHFSVYQKLTQYYQFVNQLYLKKWTESRPGHVSHLLVCVKNMYLVYARSLVQVLGWFRQQLALGACPSLLCPPLLLPSCWSLCGSGKKAMRDTLKAKESASLGPALGHTVCSQWLAPAPASGSRAIPTHKTPVSFWSAGPVARPACLLPPCPRRVPGVAEGIYLSRP